MRASSPDESVVSGWKRISTSSLVSKRHVRLDFKLSPGETDNSDCDLTASSSSSISTESIENSGVGQSLAGVEPAVFLVLHMLSYLYYIYCT